MNLKYYRDEAFRAAADKWWRSLSTNQMKAFETKHGFVYHHALLHEVAEIYDKEGCPDPQPTIGV